MAQRPPGIHSSLGFARFGRDLTRDPYGTLTAMQAKYGHVIGLSGFGRNLVILSGVKANAFMLSEHKELFRFREAYQGLVPVDGETALIVSDGIDHTRRRALVQPAFRRNHIEGYVSLMASEVNRALDHLSVGDELDAYVVGRRCIRRTVILSLFGDYLYDRADEIGEILGPALDFVNLPPQRQIRIKLPGTKYAAALRARAQVDAIVDAEVGRRRALPAADRPQHDALAMLLNASGEDGERLCAQELRDQVVSLIAAGYDTTSAALGWALHHAVVEPGVWHRARAEIAESLTDEFLTKGHLDSLGYLDGIVHEALRLHPPGVVVPRYAVNDFDFGGYLIQRKSLVMYSPYLTQIDPALWPDPLTFRPERWVPSSSNFRPEAPHSFVTFGGGSRRCIGFAFATLQLKVALALIIRRLKLLPTYDGTRRAVGLATIRPAGGVPVRVTGKSN